MQTVADMRGVGVNYRGKSADVLCGRPLIWLDMWFFQVIILGQDILELFSTFFNIFRTF